MTDFSGNGKSLYSDGGMLQQISPCFEMNGAPCIKAYQTNSQYADVATANDFAFLTAAAGSTGVVRFVLQASTGGVMLSSFGNSTANGAGVLLYMATQQLNFYLAREPGVVLNSYISGVTDISYDVPHTLVWRMNPGAPGKLNVRIDGVQVKDATNNNFNDTNPSQKLRVGAYSPPTNGTPFGGLMSDIILYNRALSDAEVTALEAWLSNTEPPASWVADTAPPAGQAVCTGTPKLMFVGDSVMEGSTGTTNMKGGLRQEVWNLADGGIGFVYDHVGPYEGTLTPPGYSDNHSDSYGGSNIRDNVSTLAPGHRAGQTNVVPSGPIGANVTTYNPDVLVLMLGTNNISGITEANRFVNDNSGDWRGLVLEAYNAKPSLRFVLMPVPAMSPDTLSTVAHFNRALASAVNRLRSEGVNITMGGTGAFNAATDTSDGKHLNDTGAVTLGVPVFRAIAYACGVADAGI
jgi:hypothetical protein